MPLARIQRLLQAQRRRDAKIAAQFLDVVNSAMAPLLVSGGQRSIDGCIARLKSQLSYGEPKSQERDHQVNDTFEKLLAMAQKQEAQKNGNVDR